MAVILGMAAILLNKPLKLLEYQKALLTPSFISVPLATQLARYCQSVESPLHLQYTDRIDIPPQVWWFHPESMLMSPEKGVIHGIFGISTGAGYELVLDGEHSTESHNQWRLVYYDRMRGQADIPLATITIEKTDRLSKAQLIENIRHAYARRKQWFKLLHWFRLVDCANQLQQIYQSELCFLLREQQFELAHQTIAEGMDILPEQWWFRLTNALLEARLHHSQEGEQAFKDWVKTYPSFRNALSLWYYYHMEHKPQEALAAFRDAILSTERMTSFELFLSYEPLIILFQSQKYREVLDMIQLIESRRPLSESYHLFKLLLVGAASSAMLQDDEQASAFLDMCEQLRKDIPQEERKRYIPADYPRFRRLILSHPSASQLQEGTDFLSIPPDRGFQPYRDGATGRIRKEVHYLFSQ